MCWTKETSQFSTGHPGWPLGKLKDPQSCRDHPHAQQCAVCTVTNSTIHLFQQNLIIFSQSFVMLDLTLVAISPHPCSILVLLLISSWIFWYKALRKHKCKEKEHSRCVWKAFLYKKTRSETRGYPTTLPCSNVPLSLPLPPSRHPAAKRGHFKL